MATAQKAFSHTHLERRIRISTLLEFDTAWRIGSGKEGETMSDLGVVLDPQGQPVLPGSSLKGKLRSTCETFADGLGMTACLLNSEVSTVKCVSDVNYYKRQADKYQSAVEKGVESQLSWIDENTCDVCKLFGSPVLA